MRILEKNEAIQIREKCIEKFVAYNSDYYKEYIKKTRLFSDGECYTGYLWDCMKEKEIILEKDAEDCFLKISQFYVLWDIHTKDRIFIPNYWKYPKASVLSVQEWSDSFKNDLPEDIYLFDDSFSWSAVFTHETDEENNKYCLYVEAKQ